MSSFPTTQRQRAFYPGNFGARIETATGLTAAELGERSDPLRKLALRFGLILVFLRVSMIHQLLASLAHVNLYLLYLFGPPALLGVLVAGGIPVVLRRRAGLLWAGYALWMLVTVPFSSWRGGSTFTVITYMRTEIGMLFVAGGLIVTWIEFRQLLWTLVAAAGIDLVVARVFMHADTQGRATLDFGSMANSNDLAAHLLYVLPFLVWLVLSSKSVVIRLAAAAAVMFGIYQTLATASRGAAVALALAILLYLIRASAAQRILALVLAPICMVVALALMPHNLVERIRSFSASNGEGLSAEAVESSQARQYLFRKSLEYTFHYPLFGIGPGTFADFEGGQSRAVGQHGNWHNSHNSITQATSEMGLLGGIFMMGGFLATMSSLKRTFKAARARSDCSDIAIAALCCSLSAFSFFVASVFLNFAYTFYLPMAAGIAIALERVAGAEFRVRSLPPVPAPQPHYVRPYRRSVRGPLPA